MWYETLAGATTEFASSVASRPAAYEVGEAVTVLYDPSHPDDVRLKGSFSLWGMLIVLVGVGAVLFRSVRVSGSGPSGEPAGPGGCAIAVTRC